MSVLRVLHFTQRLQNVFLSLVESTLLKMFCLMNIGFPIPTIKSLDFYFSLSPNLTPPLVSHTPQSFQHSSSHSSTAPSVPPGFSSIPVNSPLVSNFVSQHSKSSSSYPHTPESSTLQPQTLESSTSPLSSSEFVFVSNLTPIINTHPMQTWSKSRIHNPRLHPSLFLTQF